MLTLTEFKLYTEEMNVLPYSQDSVHFNCGYFVCFRKEVKVTAINPRRYLLVEFPTTAVNLNSGTILTDLEW